jgi:mono/diheme cytochrome c family protein
MKQFSFILLVLIFSCKDSTTDYYATNEVTKSQYTSAIGQKLMKDQCYVCHSPDAEHGNRLAPPLMVVKKHYLRGDASKEQFINDIWEWTQNPNEQNARMKGAIEKFGIMPKQVFSKEDIEQIASYMYENELEHPGKAKHHMGKGKRHNP